MLPIRTRDAMIARVNAHAERGVLGMVPAESRVPEFRDTVGSFVGTQGDDIAFLRNTSDGANVIARGLTWQPGDEIVTNDNEFGANAHPWLALREYGVSVRFVETARERMTPSVLARAMTPKTKLVAVSWVSFSDGYRHDLAGLSEIAHKGGATFVVDAIQGLGAFPLDVRALGIDALYAAGPKWLLGLAGASFVYVSPALRDRLTVRWRGWRDVADMWDFVNYEQPLAPNAARYEGGTLNFIGIEAIATSMSLLSEATTEAIGAHVLAITDRLVDGLRSKGADVLSIRDDTASSSGIVTFLMPGVDPIALGRRLGEAGIVTTFRPNGIRVSPHGYNTAAEVDALVEAL
jgi:cysteine desulfurase/selenocysteine lyase